MVPKIELVIFNQNVIIGSSTEMTLVYYVSLSQWLPTTVWFPILKISSFEFRRKKESCTYLGQFEGV